jgi:hypothetical protein
MFLKRKVLFDRDRMAGGLLGLSIVSILTVPVSAVADGPAAPSDVATAEARQSTAVLPLLGVSDSHTQVALNGLSRLNWNATVNAWVMSSPDNSWKAKFKQPSALRPLLEPNRRLNQTNTGQPPEPPEGGVNKRYLALGIFGVADVVAGAIAIGQSNKYCLTTNITTGGQSQTSCSSVPTAGKVLIPVGAAIAGLGFYMAFRHRH